MNRQTNLFSMDDNLINNIQTCLSNISSTSLAKNLSKNQIKNNIKNENLASEDNQRIIKKNNFEIVVNSIIAILGEDKFKIEKALFPQNCPFCKNNINSSFDINFLTINLNNYLGKEFDLDEFIRNYKGESTCQKCKKKYNSEFAFVLLPEILIVILGAKSENKTFSYKYSSSFKYFNKINNSPISCNYILKALIGQIDVLKFKSFLFNNEREFNNYFQQNRDIFSNPTILFYEGPKKRYNDDEEYLYPDQIEDNDVNNNNSGDITVFFNFPKYNKKIFLYSKLNEKFSKVIADLKEKYEWLQHLKNLKFSLGNKILDKNKTLAENGIQDNSEINIE